MEKHLYDYFQNNWLGEGQLWFFSDPHFSDEDLKEFRNNITDEEIVRRINSKVGKKDTIVILGDIGNIEWVKKIRGYKVLVMGNHDKGASNYQRIEHFCFPDELEDYLEMFPERKYQKIHDKVIGEYYHCDNRLFDEVYEGPLFISDKILLSHEPINYPYALNIHGHNHAQNNQNDMYHLNVCAEHIDYTPISVTSIIKSGRLKQIDSIHRHTIDFATEKKQLKSANKH